VGESVQLLYVNTFINGELFDDTRPLFCFPEDVKITIVSDNILYFAYGANQTPEMMNWITGRSSFRGRPATINGWILVIQKLARKLSRLTGPDLVK